ncbi:hypothetical protein [Staphylococcus warneri]|uniref:hypothetical protein n=1 Tax=Staphylococcus warneri TaxID=1292 RepID=UPI000E69882A|nr:hypothetical protein [Staphylococcus warneri]RIN12634.1 hypothetical protein BU086_07250 [Staphylococcus warneri]
MQYLLYIKINMMYFITRKFEFLKNKKIFKSYIFLFCLSIFMNIIITSSISYTFLNIFSDKILTIKYYYFLFSFLFIVFVPLIPRTKMLIEPLDSELLFRSQLTNLGIFNLLFLLDVIKRMQGYLNLIIIGIVITIFSSERIIFILQLASSFMFFLLLSYVVQVIYILLKVTSYKKIFSFSYLLINIFTGSLVLLIGIWLVHIINSILIKPFLTLLQFLKQGDKTFDFNEYMHTIFGEINLLNGNIYKKLNYFYLHDIFLDFNIYSIIIIILTICTLVYCIFTDKIGFWYRKFDEFLNDNLDSKIYTTTNYKKLSILKLQFINLFSDFQELILHRPYLYISYTVWLYLGIILGLTSYADNKFAMLFSITIISSSILKEGLSAGPDLFSKVLRFDSDGKSIVLYRIANIELKKVYTAKLNAIRLLGIKEPIIIIIAMIIMLKMDWKLILIIGILSVSNLIIVPHLSLLPSYISPHFKYQHFSELDHFEEQNLLDDTIFDKLKSCYSFSIYLIIIFALITERSYNDLVTFIIFWLLLLTIFLLTFVNIILRKTNKSWRKRDIYV